MMLRVKDVMSPDVETLETGETMDLANMVMTLGRVRHLPVTDKSGRLVGLVTHRDMLRAFAELFRRDGAEEDARLIPIETIMNREVITIGPNAPALEAAEAIFENKFGCLPVIEDGRVVGIVTEADFVVHAIKQLSDPGA